MFVERLGSALNRWFRRWMPDPFVLAILLTLIAMVLAVAFGTGYASDAGVMERLGVTLAKWKAFLFDTIPTENEGKKRRLLYFGFQMCVMLVTGYALATSAPVSRLVRSLARCPRGPREAVMLVAFVACCTALVHWALGLIVGAMIARETGRECRRRGIQAHYPLLGAAGYTGLMVWGGGLSGSIPLKALDEKVPGTFDNGIPLEMTLTSDLNLIVCGMLVVFIPLMAMLLQPKDASAVQPYEGPMEDELDGEGDDSEHRSRFILGLENSRYFAWLLTALALGAIIYELNQGGFKLNFTNVNFVFLFAGIALQGSLIRYVRAVGEGVSGCAGILLQFPFYFGILGILVVSGLAGQISEWIVSMSSEVMYPVATFFSAGLVNLFVPSGGGQWVVQKDIVIGGALMENPAIIGKSVMAMAYGDGWTNMLQPFWAIPLLAITQLKAREIVGYTATIMIFSGALIVGCLLLF